MGLRKTKVGDGGPLESREVVLNDLMNTGVAAALIGGFALGSLQNEATVEGDWMDQEAGRRSLQPDGRVKIEQPAEFGGVADGRRQFPLPAGRGSGGRFRQRTEAEGWHRP